MKLCGIDFSGITSVVIDHNRIWKKSRNGWKGYHSTKLSSGLTSHPIYAVSKESFGEITHAEMADTIKSYDRIDHRFWVHHDYLNIIPLSPKEIQQKAAQVEREQDEKLRYLNLKRKLLVKYVNKVKHNLDKLIEDVDVAAMDTIYNVAKPKPPVKQTRKVIPIPHPNCRCSMPDIQFREEIPGITPEMRKALFGTKLGEDLAEKAAELFSELHARVPYDIDLSTLVVVSVADFFKTLDKLEPFTKDSKAFIMSTKSLNNLLAQFKDSGPGPVGFRRKDLTVTRSLSLRIIARPVKPNDDMLLVQFTLDDGQKFP